MNITSEIQPLVHRIAVALRFPLHTWPWEESTILDKGRVVYQIHGSQIPRIWNQETLYGRMTKQFVNDRSQYLVTLYLSPLIRAVKTALPHASLPEQANAFCLGAYKVLMHELIHVFDDLRHHWHKKMSEDDINKLVSNLVNTNDAFNYAAMSDFVDFCPGLLRAFNYKGDLPFDLENISPVTHR